MSQPKFKPEFSIIIAVFNGAKFLELTLQSVINQTYSDYELVVIDGGSRDSTLAVIKKYEANISYWVSEPDKGIYDAWNKGIAKSRGQWIAFLGAGDEYHKDALMAYSQFIAEDPCDDFDYISSKVALTFGGAVSKIFGIKWKWSEFKRAMLVAHVGSIHHSSLYERFGVYDETYKIVGDYEFLLRSRDQLKAGYINILTANMSAGGISDSYSAIFEASKAKHFTGQVSLFMVSIDGLIGVLKLFLRRISCTLRNIFS